MVIEGQGKQLHSKHNILIFLSLILVLVVVAFFMLCLLKKLYGFPSLFFLLPVHLCIYVGLRNFLFLLLNLALWL